MDLDQETAVDAVSELVGKVIMGCDEGDYTVSVLLDLSKAFDSISHIILFKKT